MAVVGAGAAGLAAANVLRANGASCVVFEKARRPGGRLATVELAGGALADTGAQFFTARNRRFGSVVDAWVKAGVVHVWYTGRVSEEDRHPRYAARGGMRCVAEAMAADLDLRLSTRISSIAREGEGWRLAWPAAHGHDAGTLDSRAVVLTAPREQAAGLLDGVEIPACRYEPTAALALELDSRPELRDPGAERPPASTGWSWVADNMAKGVSERPSITLHTTAELAREVMDVPEQEAVDRLLPRAEPWTAGRAPLDVRLHRWRFATPLDIAPASFIEPAPSLLLAGDAFAGPRVEGAFLSGCAAADRILAP